MDDTNSAKIDFFNTACIMQKIFIIVFSIALLVMVFFSTSENGFAATKSIGKLDAKSAVVMDADTGTILYAKNADRNYYPASCTKILSAIIIIENSDLSDTVTVSQHAITGQYNHGSHIALRPGEKITVEDALYGMLLVSANDCSIALAEHVAGSESAFVDMMNKKAEELGMTESHFENCDGMFSKKHYSSARDLAIAMQYAVQNKTFVKIISTEKHVVPKSNKCKQKRYLYNGHHMLPLHSCAYDGVIGGKKGYITESGFNLVTYAKRGDMGLIAVVMKGSSSSANCKDTAKLFDFFFKGYKSVTLNSQAVKQAFIGGTHLRIMNRTAAVSWQRPFRVIVPKSTSDSSLYKNVSVTANLDSDISFPVKAGRKIGILTAVYNENVIGTADIINIKTLYSVKTQIMHITAAAGTGIAAALILVMIFFIYERMRSKRSKER